MKFIKNTIRKRRNLRLSTVGDRYFCRCKIVRIIDGDSYEAVVDLGFGVHLETTWRLATDKNKFINTPEIRGPEKEAGLEARAAVDRWFGDQETWIDSEWPFIVESIGPDDFYRGKYGRWLGNFYNAKGEALSAFLSESGHLV